MLSASITYLALQAWLVTNLSKQIKNRGAQAWPHFVRVDCKMPATIFLNHNEGCAAPSGEGTE